MSEKNLHSWTFVTNTNPNRNKSWYIWAFIIAGLLILYSILTANFLFGLIIIIAAILMFIYHHKEEKEVEFQISPQGITLDNKNYDFSNIENFWIVYNPPSIKNLYFKLKSSLVDNLIIPLNNENPVEIRKTLKKYLEEDLEKDTESDMEALSRFLKL